MWHWGIIRYTWRGFGTDLHEYVRVLLHLQQFLSWGGLTMSVFRRGVPGALWGEGVSPKVARNVRMVKGFPHGVRPCDLQVRLLH